MMKTLPYLKQSALLIKNPSQINPITPFLLDNHLQPPRVDFILNRINNPGNHRSGGKHGDE